MKFIFILLCWSASLFISAQSGNRSIDLKIRSFRTEVTAVSPDMAAQSMRIAAYIFNSKEFQDSILKRDFKYSNHCKDCGSGVPERRERISGEVVLDSLFRKARPDIALVLEQVGKKPTRRSCKGLGNTCPNGGLITSYYDNINCDMGDDFPFVYAYAVHLCHEYMHEVGYCHTDHKDDVAEATGWIAYHFMDLWYKNGVRIP